MPLDSSNVRDARDQLAKSLQQARRLSPAEAERRANAEIKNIVRQEEAKQNRRS